MNPFSKYQTFLQRFLAAIIDGLIFMPFIIVDNYLHKYDASNLVFLGWMLLNTIAWSLYSIIGHGKYGQTISKKVMDIKVLDLDEMHVIGYKRAFLRESFWIVASLIVIAYCVYVMITDPEEDVILRSTLFETYMDLIT